MRSIYLSALVALVGSFVGCGSASQPAAAPSAQGADYRLSSEPKGARDVKEVKDEVQDGEAVVIVGRVGGDTNPWVEGQAAFLVVDKSLKPCNEQQDDACETPWDYCCDTDLLPASKAMVKVVDQNGKTVPSDARQLLGIKELQTVVVRGKAKRDDAGNLTVLADGIYVRN